MFCPRDGLGALQRVVASSQGAYLPAFASFAWCSPGKGYHQGLFGLVGLIPSHACSSALRSVSGARKVRERLVTHEACCLSQLGGEVQGKSLFEVRWFVWSGGSCEAFLKPCT